MNGGDSTANEPVEVQDFGRITNRFRGICGACLKVYKE